MKLNRLYQIPILVTLTAGLLLIPCLSAQRAPDTFARADAAYIKVVASLDEVLTHEDFEGENARYSSAHVRNRTLTTRVNIPYWEDEDETRYIFVGVPIRRANIRSIGVEDLSLAHPFELDPVEFEGYKWWRTTTPHSPATSGYAYMVTQFTFSRSDHVH